MGVTFSTGRPEMPLRCPNGDAEGEVRCPGNSQGWQLKFESP